jgi:hypothetical protein
MKQKIPSYFNTIDRSEYFTQLEKKKVKHSKLINNIKNDLLHEELFGNNQYFIKKINMS